MAHRAPDTVALTHPASWGGARLNILLKAAAEAGLGRVRLVPEPEAAADFFTKIERRDARPATVVVYDFGGGAAVEDLHGYFTDRDGIFCVTELFELDTCLNEDFETSVKLNATGEYFCLSPNDR